jgi:hypothetical protein
MPTRIGARKCYGYVPKKLDTDAAAYLAQTSYDAVGAAAINSYFVGLKADGVWDKIIDHGIFAGQTTFNNIFVKLKGSGTLTNNNFISSDYNKTGANIGLKGNGVSKYLSNLQLANNYNHSLGVYVTEEDTSSFSRCLIGINYLNTSSDNLSLRYKQFDNYASFTSGRDSSTYRVLYPISSYTGFSIGTASATNSMALSYWGFNDTVPTGNNRTNNRISYNPVYPVSLFASTNLLDNTIDAGSCIAARIASYVQASALTSTEAQSFRDRLQTLLIALGFTF